MSKHTPGPWTLETVATSCGTCHKIGPFPSKGVRDVTHACVYADNVNEADYGFSAIGDELLANAHLIAAAPEMYEALKELYLIAYSRGIRCETIADGKLCTDVILNAKAALIKAGANL